MYTLYLYPLLYNENKFTVASLMLIKHLRVLSSCFPFHISKPLLQQLEGWLPLFLSWLPLPFSSLPPLPYLVLCKNAFFTSFGLQHCIYLSLFQLNALFILLGLSHSPHGSLLLSFWALTCCTSPLTMWTIICLSLWILCWAFLLDRHILNFFWLWHLVLASCEHPPYPAQVPMPCS